MIRKKTKEGKGNIRRMFISKEHSMHKDERRIEKTKEMNKMKTKPNPKKLTQYKKRKAHIIIS